MNIAKKNTLFCLIVFSYMFFSLSSIATSSITKNITRNKPATNSAVINYAKSLLLTIVDSNFRGSWVIDPENWEKTEEKTKQMQKPFTSLSKVKLGYAQQKVREVLKNPQETRNNGKIWIYGTQNEDGTYNNLLEVFFDDKTNKVISIITFDPKNTEESLGVNIGDSIDKMISVYGEPESENDFIEDQDNKDYLGLYYLYPKQRVGFLIGQDKATNNLLVQSIIVF